jgi:trehalose/maltose transport system substrate-binding protein
LRESGFSDTLETAFSNGALETRPELFAGQEETMRARALIVAAGCIAALAGCGGGGDDAGGGSAASKPTASAAGGALEPAAADGAKGNVTLCLPKDVSGAFHKTIDAYNRSQSAVKANLFELSESADEQRNQLVQRLEAKSPECDVMGIDVIWTAEFASQKWVKDLTPVIAARKSEFIPSTVATGVYEGRNWAFPYNSNAALLYYRTDQVSKAPASWEDVYRDAAADSGVVYQGAAYEGLTCDFLELLYSAGGEVLTPDGKSPAIDSPVTRQVLDFMVKGVKDGTAANGVTTYMEEESRRYWESGKATFMRNWPYAYALGNKAPAIKGKFKITTLPGIDGKPGVGVLGGTQLAINAYTDNPGASLAVVNYFTSDVGQRYIGEGSTPPVTKAAYQDPAVRKALGLPDEIERAIGAAKPRPVSPVYPQISQAIYQNVNRALAGRTSTDAAVKAMSSQIQEALKTF